jgi:proteic killer suppression protein
MAIKSFRNRETEALFQRRTTKRLGPDISRLALRKLLYLHAATELEQLRSPPGNRLELLSGDRRGQHSIRINDQFRICFKWHEGNAWDVEIVDYQ